MADGEMNGRDTKFMILAKICVNILKEYKYYLVFIN